MRKEAKETKRTKMTMKKAKEEGSLVFQNLSSLVMFRSTMDERVDSRTIAAKKV